MKEQKGVTLVVLAITVMVLVVIIGVVFTAGIGQKSQVKEVVDASEQSFHDNVKDALMLLGNSYTSKAEYLKYLREHDYVGDNSEVNVSRVLEATNIDYGKGSNFKDVYTLTDDLTLTYYNKNGEAKYLGNLGATMEE